MGKRKRSNISDDEDESDSSQMSTLEDVGGCKTFTLSSGERKTVPVVKSGKSANVLNDLLLALAEFWGLDKSISDLEILNQPQFKSLDNEPLSIALDSYKTGFFQIQNEDGNLTFCYFMETGEDGIAKLLSITHMCELCTSPAQVSVTPEDRHKLCSIHRVMYELHMDQETQMIWDKMCGDAPVYETLTERNVEVGDIIQVQLKVRVSTGKSGRRSNRHDPVILTRSLPVLDGESLSRGDSMKAIIKNHLAFPDDKWSEEDQIVQDLYNEIKARHGEEEWEVGGVTNLGGGAERAHFLFWHHKKKVPYIRTLHPLVWSEDEGAFITHPEKGELGLEGDSYYRCGTMDCFQRGKKLDPETGLFHCIIHSEADRHFFIVDAVVEDTSHLLFVPITINYKIPTDIDQLKRYLLQKGKSMKQLASRFVVDNADDVKLEVLHHFITKAKEYVKGYTILAGLEFLHYFKVRNFHLVNEWCMSTVDETLLMKFIKDNGATIKLQNDPVPVTVDSEKRSPWAVDPDPSRPHAYITFSDRCIRSKNKTKGRLDIGETLHSTSRHWESRGKDTGNFIWNIPIYQEPFNGVVVRGDTRYELDHLQGLCIEYKCQWNAVFASAFGIIMDGTPVDLYFQQLFRPTDEDVLPHLQLPELFKLVFDQDIEIQFDRQLDKEIVYDAFASFEVIDFEDSQ